MKKQSKGIEQYKERIKRSLAPVVAPEKVADQDMLRGFIALGLVEDNADNRALTKSSRSKDWLARIAVCLHPNATEAQLSLLGNDSHSEVSAAASNALSKRDLKRDGP